MTIEHNTRVVTSERDRLLARSKGTEERYDGSWSEA